MESLKQHAQDALVNALIPSPPPPSPPILGDQDLPSLQDFLGTVVFFLSFFTSLTDFFESDDLPLFYKCGDFQYKSIPYNLVIGNGLGFIAFALAYAQLNEFQLGHHGHYLLLASVFFFYARHLSRVAEISRRRASIISAFGTLPLVCIAVLDAETVSVTDCNMFFILQIIFATMPLPALFRDWRSSMFDQTTAKAKKRLFLLFFALIVFVGSISPRRNCFLKKEPSEFSMGITLAFDLTLLYIASDSIWH